MNEVLTLMVVLLVIYFLECLSLVPEGNFVFRVKGLQRWRPAKSLMRLERHQSQMYLSHFFPGWGDIAICASNRAAHSQPGIDTKQELRKMLDTKAACRQLRAYRRLLRPLYWDSYLLFAVIFIFFPLVAFLFGFWMALSLVPVFLLGVVHMVCAFRRVHQAFAPDSVSERREKTIGLLLSPLGAIRVPGLLLRNSTARFHPLAVAAAIMPAVEARQVASGILRQLRFAALEHTEPSTLQSSCTQEEWRSVVWEWAAREFGDPESLLGAPVKRYRESISYCPRCEQEYLLAAGECSDCPGMSLAPFPETTVPAPAHIQPPPAPR